MRQQYPALEGRGKRELRDNLVVDDAIERL